jgi:hypothetical protein
LIEINGSLPEILESRESGHGKAKANIHHVSSEPATFSELIMVHSNHNVAETVTLFDRRDHMELVRAST